MNTLTIIPTEREELAWAAGFLDGEANIKFSVPKSGGTGRLDVQVAQVRKEPLDRLSNLFGGKVYGPYKNNQDGALRQEYFLWQASTYERAVRVIELVWPWLSDPKKEQASKAIEAYDNRRPPKKSGPALKTECLRSHDLTDPSNVYITPSGGRQCKLCNQIRKNKNKVETS